MAVRRAILASITVFTTLLQNKHECLAISIQNPSSKTATRRAILSSLPLTLLTPLSLPPLQASAATSDSYTTSPSTISRPPIPGARIQYNPTGEGLSYTPPSPLLTTLGCSRIGARELSPLTPSLVPFQPQELYYPQWMFGSWNVTAVLKRKTFPYGVEVLPSSSLVEGSPRNRHEQLGDGGSTYEIHYYSTLPPTLSNQVTTNLGLGIPKSKIILDRAFAAKSISEAYQQVVPVNEVEWDPSADPTRITLNYNAGLISQDLRPLGPRRTEVYITARDSESDEKKNIYCTSEASRIVQLSAGNVITSDTETTTEYALLDDNTITATIE